jgi:hypothetical protein
MRWKIKLSYQHHIRSTNIFYKSETITVKQTERRKLFEEYPNIIPAKFWLNSLKTAGG